MHTLRVLHELPPGYCVEETPRGILALLVEVALDFHARGFGPEQDGGLEGSDLAGRHPLRQLVVGSERFVVRTFHHGGLLRWLTGDRFLDPERPFRELILAHTLNRSGLPTPQIVAARARYGWGPGFYLDVVSRRIEGGMDVGRVLGRVQRGELEPLRVRGLVRACGRLVRSLHKRRVLHADLTLRNVLTLEAEIESEDPALWILDLEDSRVLNHLSERERLDNLRRLFRHVERMQRSGGMCLSRTDLARFLMAYHGARRASFATEADAAQGVEPSRPAARGVGPWKEDWRAIARARARHRFWHHLGWWFDTHFGKLSTLPAADQAREIDG